MEEAFNQPGMATSCLVVLVGRWAAVGAHDASAGRCPNACRHMTARIRSWCTPTLPRTTSNGGHVSTLVSISFSPAVLLLHTRCVPTTLHFRQAQRHMYSFPASQFAPSPDSFARFPGHTCPDPALPLLTRPPAPHDTFDIVCTKFSVLPLALCDIPRLHASPRQQAARSKRHLCAVHCGRGIVHKRMYRWTAVPCIAAWPMIWLDGGLELKGLPNAAVRAASSLPPPAAADMCCAACSW